MAVLRPSPPPSEVITDPNPVDGTLADVQSQLRRQDSSAELPIGARADPWLVPVGQFRVAQAEQIRRSAASMAVRHDSADIGANFNVQGAYERLTGQFDPNPAPQPPEPDYTREAMSRFGGGAGVAAVAMDATQYELEADRRTALWEQTYRLRFGKNPTSEQIASQRSVEHGNIASDISDTLAHPAANPATRGLALIGQPFAPLRKFLTGEDPMDAVLRAGRVLIETPLLPWAEGFRAIDFVRALPESDFLHFDVSGEDVRQWVGKGADAVDRFFEITGMVLNLERPAAAFATTGVGQQVVESATQLVENPAVQLGTTYGMAGFGPRSILTAQKLGVPPTRYVADLPTLDELAAHVQNSTNPVARALVGKSGINPSVLLNTALGRIGLAYKQGEMAAEALTEVAMSGIDSYATRVTGRAAFGRNGWLFRVNREGVLTNVTPKAEAPVVGFSRMGAVIQRELPRVEEGMTRLWRGNRPDEVGANPSFTNSLEGIALPFREMYGGALSYVDVPTEELGKYARTVGVAHGAEFALPQQIASAARAVGADALRVAGENRGRSLNWGDVFSRPGDYNLTPPQQEFIDLVHRVVNETNEMLVRAGRPSRALDTSPEGWFYVPRTVQQIKDQIVHGFTNPHMERTFAERAQGIAAGMRYSNDLRATIATYIRGTFHEVNASRLTEAVKREAVASAGGEFGLNAAGERIAAQPWKQYLLPAEMAQELERNVPSIAGKDSPNWAAASFQNLGDAMRFHASVGDWAAPFLQGQLLLTRDPVAWAKATALHYEAFFDPTTQSRYMRDHIATFQEMAKHGVPVGDNEFFSALATGRATNVFGLLQKATKRLPDALHGDDITLALGEMKQQSFGRFQATYDTFLATSRSMLWEGLAKNIPEGFSRGRHIRNMTGGLDSRALGVSANQRGFESTWLAFAPRFLRSTGALAMEMFDADPAIRKEAIRSVGSLLGGVTMAYIATGIALGKSQEEITTGLNPLEGKKFISHEINGDWVGVGGVARAYVHLLAGSVALGVETVLNPAEMLGNASLKSFFDAEQNPVLNFIESRGAPGANIARAFIEAASGGTIDALPFKEVNNMADFAKHLWRSSLPFAVQGWLDGQGLTADVASEFGLRTSPQTSSERRTQILTDAARAGGFADGFDEKEPAAIARVRQQLKGADPTRLAELDQIEADKIAQWERDVAIRHDPLARASLAGVKARDAIAAEIAKNPDDLEHIRLFASDAQAAARAIRDEPDVKAALAALKPNEAQWAADLDKYFKIFDAATPALRDDAEAALRKELGAERMGRVLQNVFAVTHDMPPAWERIQRDKQQLTEAGFFDLSDPAWRATQDIARRQLSRDPALWQPVLNAPTFAAWTEAAVKAEAARGAGVEPAVAQSRAKNAVSAMAPAAMFDGQLQLQRMNWQRSHQALAREAIALGYLGAGAANSFFSGITQPRSQNIPLNERLVAEHASGLSYGQIAEKYDMTRDAVIGRIKRTRESGDGEPLVASFVRDDDGRIVGMERAPMQVIRDAEGRPVGIGRASA